MEPSEYSVWNAETGPVSSIYVHHFCFAVTKVPDSALSCLCWRKSSFCLTVSKGSVLGCLCSGTWAEDPGIRSLWWRNTGYFIAKQEVERKMKDDNCLAFPLFSFSSVWVLSLWESHVHSVSVLPLTVNPL